MGLELEGSYSASYPKPFPLRSCDGRSALLALLGLDSLRGHTSGHAWNVGLAPELKYKERAEH